MIVVLLGATASGKDYYKTRLLQELDLTSVVTYTTRPIRQGEVEGVTYHYVSDEEMSKMIESDEMLEYSVYDTVYGKWTYGTHIDSFKDKHCICILDYQGYKKVKELYGNKVIAFLIERDEDARREAYLSRGGDLDEYLRRSIADRKKFDLAQFDRDIWCINNNCLEMTDRNIEVMKEWIERGITW